MSMISGSMATHLLASASGQAVAKTQAQAQEKEKTAVALIARRPLKEGATVFPRSPGYDMEERIFSYLNLSELSLLARTSRNLDAFKFELTCEKVEAVAKYIVLGTDSNLDKDLSLDEDPSLNESWNQLLQEIKEEQEIRKREKELDAERDPCKRYKGFLKFLNELGSTISISTGLIRRLSNKILFDSVFASNFEIFECIIRIMRKQYPKIVDCSFWRTDPELYIIIENLVVMYCICPDNMRINYHTALSQFLKTSCSSYAWMAFARQNDNFRLSVDLQSDLFKIRLHEFLIELETLPIWTDDEMHTLVELAKHDQAAHKSFSEFYKDAEKVQQAAVTKCKYSLVYKLCSLVGNLVRAHKISLESFENLLKKLNNELLSLMTQLNGMGTLELQAFCGPEIPQADLESIIEEVGDLESYKKTFAIRIEKFKKQLAAISHQDSSAAAPSLALGLLKAHHASSSASSASFSASSASSASSAPAASSASLALPEPTRPESPRNAAAKRKLLEGDTKQAKQAIEIRESTPKDSAQQGNGPPSKKHRID